MRLFDLIHCDGGFNVNIKFFSTETITNVSNNYYFPEPIKNAVNTDINGNGEIIVELENDPESLVEETPCEK
jgi:hypothetical protein